jgi:hypothetical protein
MRKVTFFIAILIATGVSAQKGKVLDARNSVATNDLKNAKILIDEAGNDAAFANDPHYYYWKGYIYKELYKEQDKGKNAQSKLREESLNAFVKLMEYKHNIAEDTLNSAIKSLNFLGSTYWNDAVISADTVNYDVAIENYHNFRKVSQLIDPSNDLTDKDIKFYTKIATIYMSLYDVRTSSPSGDVFFEKAKNEYLKIITMDENNLTANYNLGIHFYNKAVNIIKDMDVETSLEELAEKEEICVGLFLQSLPYVKKAYEIDPQRKETLIGLTGIYWSLNDLEKYQYYQEKLKELE